MHKTCASDSFVTHLKSVNKCRILLDSYCFYCTGIWLPAVREIAVSMKLLFHWDKNPNEKMYGVYIFFFFVVSRKFLALSTLTAV